MKDLDPMFQVVFQQVLTVCHVSSAWLFGRAVEEVGIAVKEDNEMVFAVWSYDGELATKGRVNKIKRISCAQFFRFFRHGERFVRMLCFKESTGSCNRC
jgi:hypothetical protein